MMTYINLNRTLLSHIINAFALYFKTPILIAVLNFFQTRIVKNKCISLFHRIYSMSVQKMTHTKEFK